LQHYPQNCTLNVGDTQLTPVDLDTAVVPDPSVAPSAEPPGVA
jgi:hypothetical protein